MRPPRTKTLVIVVGLVREGDEILLLQRSREKRHAPQKWEPVGGFLRRFESAQAAVTRCARERAGLETTIVRSGCAFECEDAGAWWIVKPFLLHPAGPHRQVRLGDGHIDHVWVSPERSLALDCVDGLREDLDAVGLVVPVAA